MAGKAKTAPSCKLADLEKSGPIELIARCNGVDTLLGVASPRLFSTGSYGYGLSGKQILSLGDNKFANLQLSCNCTVINSKDAPAEWKESTIVPEVETETEVSTPVVPETIEVE